MTSSPWFFSCPFKSRSKRAYQLVPHQPAHKAGRRCPFIFTLRRQDPLHFDSRLHALFLSREGVYIPGAIESWSLLVSLGRLSSFSPRCPHLPGVYIPILLPMSSTNAVADQVPQRLILSSAQPRCLPSFFTPLSRLSTFCSVSLLFPSPPLSFRESYLSRHFLFSSWGACNVLSHFCTFALWGWQLSLGAPYNKGES